MKRKVDPFAAPVNERAYAHTISLYCPNINEVELQARCDLARIRDESAIGLSRGSEHISGVLHDVSRLATQAVYAPMETSKLIRLRGTLQLLLEGARMMERVLK